MSPSVPNQRIRELSAADLVGHAPGGYRLTLEGQSLLASIAPLDQWAKRCARRI